MDFSKIVRDRRSIKAYDSSKTISLGELKSVFEEVLLSPSSFNLQHWTFIAVTDPALKKQLRSASWNQPQVEESSVAILVCGKLDAYRDASRIYAEVPKEVQERTVPMILNFYEGKEQLIRDEAIRSASLAAMTLMYAAKNRGWDTGPMIGFDPVAVAELLHLTPNYIPVMLVVLGHGKGSAFPRAYRRPVSEIVKMNTLDGKSL